MKKCDKSKEIMSLLSRVLRKEIDLDAILELEYDIKDFIQCQKELNTNKYNISKNEYWNDFGEKYTINSFCSGLIEACKNKKTLDNEDKNSNEETIATGEHKYSNESSENNSFELSMDWDDEEEVSADSIYDGYLKCLSKKGYVDIDYIQAITDRDKDEIINELKNSGCIYQNPNNGRWETGSEYLSGNMSKKLKEAREAERKNPGQFNNNIEAIQKNYCQLKDNEEIYVTLGSPWIPVDVIDDFLKHLFGNFRFKDKYKITYTRHDDHTGIWELPDKTCFNMNSDLMISSWGIKECSAYTIISDTLNQRSVTVYKPEEQGVKKDGSLGLVKPIDMKKTLLAQDKQNRLIQEFQRWIWEDDDRKRRLRDIYEDKYCNYIQQKYDGSFLKFPGMNSEIKMRDYQKNAIARIISGGNVLLAHDIGSGKTFEMIAAGMELNRIGLSRKNMYVVPNNIVGQWKNTFKKMYPQASLLVIDPKVFVPKNRLKVIQDIRDKDYHGIIIAFSCFEEIPISNQTRIAELLKEKKELQLAKTKAIENVSILKSRIDSI
ncbi:MAG: DEAD/DEAH box helicase family protein, partial [Oscillospiraceae bacterium]|nr:DEAD/DEAH box helicase family protein [Oscillospiraceae bacterium]